MKRAAFALFALGASGCGLKEPLAAPPGQAAPPVPAMARRAPTTEEMLTPPPIAQPDRVDELIRRSEAREDDRFDLPPPDIAADDPINGDEPPE
jgi:hypothetical protein